MEKNLLVLSSVNSQSNTSIIHACNMAKNIDKCNVILLTAVQKKNQVEEAKAKLETKKAWIRLNFPGQSVISVIGVNPIKKFWLILQMNLMLNLFL